MILEHNKEKYNFVNEKVVDGVTYKLYRRIENRVIREVSKKEILVKDGKIEKIKDPKTYYKKLKKQDVNNIF